MSVHCYSGQGEDGDAHREHLYERTKRTHEVRQIPPLQQRGLKLEAPERSDGDLLSRGEGVLTWNGMAKSPMTISERARLAIK